MPGPLLKLLAASIGAIWVLKLFALVTRPGRLDSIGLIAFLFPWPGIIPDYFRTRKPSQTIDAARFLPAWTRTAGGCVSVILLAVFAPRIPEAILGPAGIVAILLTIHLGICDLLPWLLRWAGYPVPLLFDRPWRAISLNDFWSRRWNLAFVDMNQRLFLRGFYRMLGKRGSRFALFVVSGLLHEMGLSFPAGAGWGLPLAYFLLQGTLVEIEDRLQIQNRAWTWFWVLAPAPWLFHEPFRHVLIVPFYGWLHGVLTQNSGVWYLSRAIYAAALGQSLVLIASFQVPTRLGWKVDIPKLTRFNQKVFWLYGFYILLCIVSFGVMTWRLHDELLAGDRSARCLAIFIAIFWTIRVLADVFWYDHRDWPAGNALLIGHALVTSLFTALAATYWFTVFAPYS